jgi:hypothetical protein
MRHLFGQHQTFRHFFLAGRPRACPVIAPGCFEQLMDTNLKITFLIAVMAVTASCGTETPAVRAPPRLAGG